MQKVLTAAQMREVDRLTTERYGIPSIILMENAAHAVARVITEKLGGSVKGKSILILCGKGNNGGDGTALARLLWKEGAHVSAQLFVKREEMKGDARLNADVLTSLPQLYAHGNQDGVHLAEFGAEQSWTNTTGFHVHEYDVVVDAVFGTGVTRPLDEDYRFLTYVGYLKRNRGLAKPFLVSVDLPSGLNADGPERPEPSFEADVTVTFTTPKPANILAPAFRASGELIVANIGSPKELVDAQPSQLFVTEAFDVERWLESARFWDDSYKNKRGHALVIAGSETYSGAAVLAGNSAIRSGVGLVTLACPAEAKTEIASRILPEVILATLGSPDFDELAPKANAIAVGPGLSATDPDIESLVRKIVEERTTPVIVDAGALWFFNPPAGIPKDADRNVRVPLILTPHEGEFMRLLGTDDKNVIKDRVAAVREFATTNNVILVLKGERVLIGHPDGRVVVNPTGNSGLGKAGNGDTLTGVLAGFCAQAAAMEIDIFETVVAAVYIAGLAGDIAEKKYGKRVMTASDVRECLAEAFAQCEAAAG
jgi:hydroxyethylthiazole kinase-like uncharacterized protein yjeF